MRISFKRLAEMLDRARRQTDRQRPRPGMVTVNWTPLAKERDSSPEEMTSSDERWFECQEEREGGC